MVGIVRKWKFERKNIFSRELKAREWVIKLYLVATQLHENSGNNIQLNDKIIRVHNTISTNRG